MDKWYVTIWPRVGAWKYTIGMLTCSVLVAYLYRTLGYRANTSRILLDVGILGLIAFGILVIRREGRYGLGAMGTAAGLVVAALLIAASAVAPSILTIVVHFSHG